MRATASMTRAEWPCAVSTTMTSTPAAISASRAREAVGADRRCRADAQAAVFVLRGVRMRLGLLDVLDRDEADAAELVVDDEQLFDAMRVQQALGLVHADVLAHGDELVLASSAATRAGAGRWRSARRDWSECRRACRSSGSTTGMPEMRCVSRNGPRFGERRVGRDGDRIEDDAAFEFLHLAHVRGLFFDAQLR